MVTSILSAWPASAFVASSLTILPGPAGATDEPDHVVRVAVDVPALHARLAALTGAPVIPLGLWGTEQVWPRSARTPDFTLVRHPPTVTVRVGQPLPLSLTNAKADTVTLMTAISALLPAASRVRHEPTPEELARTKPPA